jgi:hypothetical protein
MSRTRRTFGKTSKPKLEALKKDTIEVLAKVRAVAQSNFNVEVRSGIFLQFFCRKNGRYQDEIPTEKLYARIGQLTLE